jgi:chloramphenicol 3-O phosphotransferase
MWSSTSAFTTRTHNRTMCSPTWPVASAAHHVLADVARRVARLPAYLVGVRCPLEVILERRAATADDGGVDYAQRGADGAVPEPVLRWQEAVHQPGIYDFEVDTSSATPEECARAIASRMAAGPPEAFGRLAGSRP